ITFNEQVDSAALGTAAVSTNPVLTETSRTIPPGLTTNSFSLEFAETITTSQSYTITISGVQDCWGNTGNPSATFVLPAAADSGDVVINEVLFDQYTGGSDWVELYNKSGKLINLKG